MGVELDATIKDNFTPTINKWKESLSGVDDAVKGLNRSVDDQSKIINSQAAAINKTSAALREATQAEENARKTKAASRDETQKLSDALGDSIQKLRAQKDLLQDPVFSKNLKYQSDLKAEVDKLTDSITKGDAVTKRQSMSMADMVAGYYMARQAAGFLASGVMSIVDAAKQYDSVRVRLTATEGSALVADKDLKNLQELAKLPDLGFGEASSAMASLRSLHVSAKDTFALIEGIAKGNASMGGGAEAFGRVMYQISQSIGKSKVDMTDLKPVMEAIPNMGAMIQEKFGSIDSESINKKLTSMGKTSKDFWMDVAEMASKLPPAGDTIANNIDNIGDAWIRFKASLGDPEQIKALTGALAKLLDKVAEYREKGSAEQALRLRAEASLGVGKGSAPGRLFNMMFHGDEVEARMAKIRELDAFNLKTDEEEKAKKDKALVDKLAADKKRDEAKQKADKNRESEAKRIAAHNLESQKNVVTNSDGSVTLRSGLDYEGSDDAEHGRNRAGAEKTADAKAERALKKKVKDAEDAARDIEKINKLAETQRAKNQETEARLLSESLEARKREWRSYADEVQKLGATQVSNFLQGEFSIKSAMRSTKDVAINMIAERSTKAIEAMIEEAIFGKATAAAQAATQSAAMAAIAASAAPAAAGVSIATGGAAAVAAMASLNAAYAQANILASLSAVPRANGGPSFGRTLVGERGMEFATPIVPSVITPSHKTTNNYGGNVTIVVKGAVDNRTLRNIREAVTDRRQSSR